MPFNTAILNGLKSTLSSIIGEEGSKEMQEKSEEEILRLIYPSYWNLYENENIEVEIEMGYEELILSVSKYTTEDMNRITTFKFYVLKGKIKKEHSKK